MLSYSRCCDFYRCPYLFQCHDEVILDTPAIRLGTQIDTLLNILMMKHMTPELRHKKAIELGVSQMLQTIVDSGDICTMFQVPPMVKNWYIDFVTSGLQVVDCQRHFILEDLDYHGYIDGIVTDGTDTWVIENKTTSRYYDKFFTSKKNSYQAVGYALATGTRLVRYQFFDTKTMSAYTPVSRVVTNEDIDEFKQWVKHVQDNSQCFVKNKEWCSLNDCPIKEECW